MSLTRNTDDLNIIQKLDDEPNDVGGETAASLKEQFDKASNLLKTYINGVLLPELEKAGVLSLIQHGTDSCKFIRLNADGAVETSADGASWTVTASSGHLVYDANGKQLPQRSRMKFLNSTISDDGTFTVINGIKGDKGDTGAKGDTGSAATFEIGTVSTGAEGSSVIITNSGTKNAAVLNFTIPQGKKGSAWYPTVDGLGNLTFALSDTSVQPPVYNIRGPQGQQGIQGAQGVQGPKGDTGTQGIQGVQGVQGKQGETGPSGAVGPAGPSGPTGPQGLRGDDGADGKSFVVRSLYPTLLALQTAHPTGNEGDAYAVGTADKNVVYIWSVDKSAWDNVGALQGPQGPQGATGATGPQGAVGATGPQGPQGVQGIQGEKGATGPAGPQGIQGVSGKDGTSAYTSACNGGYSGTETAFNSALAGVPNKADKCAPSAVGNFASLSSDGNLSDSGKKPSDFAPASHKHTKSDITDFPGSMTPTTHASTHKSGGADQITPADIGAYTKVESDTLLSNKADKDGGTFTGALCIDKTSIIGSTIGTYIHSNAALGDEWQLFINRPTDATVPDTLNTAMMLCRSSNGNTWDAAYNVLHSGNVGNFAARIAMGSYVGTGTYGSSNPCSLTFGFEPKVVFICAPDYVGTIDTVVCMRDAGFAYTHRNNTNYYLTLGWSEKTLKWWDGGASADYQLNVSGKTYKWVAIG